jgi:AcrR family transcriptional regulator
MSQVSLEPSLDRRTQILEAAIVCFAKRGFHQTSMHDVSAEAGISVGLIYRYFANKEAVIAAMADRHKTEIHDLLERARQAPSLFELPHIARRVPRKFFPRLWSTCMPKRRGTRRSPIWSATF